MGDGSVKLVCFYLHDQEFAADITAVVETMAVRPITRVFLTPPWLAGIINLRGDVVPIIDLANLLGMSETLLSDDSRIVLVRHAGTRAGFLVDGLAELVTLPLDRLSPPPATLDPELAQFVRGVASAADDRLVRVLDMAALFESDRLRTLDGARTERGTQGAPSS
jgi:purine-binding chemotaxis protein CheW